MKKSNVYIVVAAYNEGKALSKVIEDLQEHGYNNVVVVDDGSKDNTYQVASKHKIHCLKHVINRGQGAALQTGVDYALQKGADYIVTFDADGQHHAEDVKKLLKAARKKSVDVALGSRFLEEGTNLPFIRKLVLKTGVFVMWLLYRIKLTDSHNGFRVFTREAAETVEITSDRMEHASQIIEEVKKKNLSYEEVPVTITYSDYSMDKGQSSFNSVKIGLRMLFRKFFR